MSATATRPKIRPLDPLDLDGLLSDEDRLIAETVRRFATDRVLPNVEQWYEEGTLPTRELAPAIGELGLLGMHLSGYGCAGASARATTTTTSVGMPRPGRTNANPFPQIAR